DRSLLIGDEPERVRGLAVAGDLLQVLKLKAEVGRAFLPEEEVFGQQPVAMISHALWRRRFGRDPSALGKSVNVDGRDHTIIGVLPPEVDFPRPDVAIWVPLAPQPGGPEASRGNRSLEILGRLKPGATLDRAAAELQTIARR